MYSCKDYKKVGEGDEGMNTGGMGTVAPSPEFNGMHYADFERNIMLPTLKGLKQENLSFKRIYFLRINGYCRRQLPFGI